MGHLHITSYIHLTVILKLKCALTKEAKYKVIISLLTIKCPWIKIYLEKVVRICLHSERAPAPTPHGHGFEPGCRHWHRNVIRKKFVRIDVKTMED